MSARVIPDASITISLDGRALDADGVADDAGLSTALKSAIEALAAAGREARSRPDDERFLANLTGTMPRPPDVVRSVPPASSATTIIVKGDLSI